MADSEQLIQLGQVLGNFGELGLKTAFTMSELEENKRAEEWSSYVRQRQVQRDRLEDLQESQLHHIRAEYVQLAADGIKGMSYGGNPADSYAIYKNMRLQLEANPQLQKIIATDPAAMKAVGQFFSLANGTLTSKGVGGGAPTLPDGQPYPNLENLRLNEGKYAGMKDASIIASRIPQYVEVTKDGKKMTLDQRQEFYRLTGYLPEAIHYDTVAGVLTATEGEFDQNMRGVKWNIDHGLPNTAPQGFAAVKLSDIGSPVMIGGQSVEFEKALPRMISGEGDVTSAFIASQPDPKIAVQRLAAAGVPVTDAMVAKALTGKADRIAFSGTDGQVAPAALLGEKSFSKIKPAYDAVVIGVQGSGKEAVDARSGNLSALVESLPGMETVSPEILAVAMNGETPGERQMALNAAIRQSGAATVARADGFRAPGLNALDQVVSVAGAPGRAAFLEQLQAGDRKAFEALKNTKVNVGGEMLPALAVLRESAEKLKDGDLNEALGVYGAAGATEARKNGVVVRYADTLDKLFDSLTKRFGAEEEAARLRALAEEASKTQDMSVARGIAPDLTLSEQFARDAASAGYQE